jgi:hypothetical protein
MNTKALKLELTMSQIEELLRCVPGRLGWLETQRDNPACARAAIVLRAAKKKLEWVLAQEWTKDWDLEQ